MAGRRDVLLGLGGVLVAGAAAGTWRIRRMPQTAIAPWQSLTQPVADPRLDAFRHAILAPNPHNRQPWLIKLEGADSAVLSCDLGKRLPQTDPFDRQITIGFGAFIELAVIAASHRGQRVEVEPFPDGEPQPRLDQRGVARLTFVADATVTPDPLFAAISSRRTVRGRFGPLPDGTLGKLTEPGVVLSDDPARLAALRKIAVAAMTTEMTTPHAHMESVGLMRIGAAEIDAQPDGLALSGPMIEATALVGLTSRASLADPTSQSFQIGLKDLQESITTLPAAAWITTPDNSRASQLAAGRTYARLALRAAANDAAIHPLSQALQEYPEMAGLYAEVHGLLAPAPGERLQMLVRLGTADPTPPTARYPLESHLLP